MTEVQHRRSARGFTLIELLLALSIISIVASLAGPSLSRLVDNNRLRTEANRVLTTLTLTRSEAVKLNQPVTICSSEDGLSCGGDWEDGWIVFSNVDADATVDTGTDRGVRVYEGVNHGVSLAGNLGVSTLTYYGDGTLAAGSGTIAICDAEASTSRGWGIRLNAAGRPRMQKGVASCDSDG